MRFLPLTRQVELDYANPEKVISALPGTYFYRSGNDLFYLIRDGERTRLEVSKRSFTLAYQNQTWFPTITNDAIIFSQPTELWVKKPNSYGSTGWEFVSYKAYSYIPQSPTPTPSITPTISVTPTITPSITPTATVTPTLTNTPTSTPTPTTTVTPTVTDTPTPTPTPTATVTPTVTDTPTSTPVPTATPSSTPPDLSMISSTFISTYGIQGVFSNKSKVENYSGPIWKIRRSSDNTLQDCYSISDVSTFVGGGTAYVQTWYDQSGNGYHFTENTDSVQPTLIISDPIFGGPCVQLGTGKGMSGTFSDTSTETTIGVSYAEYILGGQRVLAGSGNWLMGPYNEKNNLYAGAFVNGPSIVLNTAYVNVGWRSTGNWALRVNGSDVGSSGGGSSPGTISLGIRGAFGESANSKVQTIIYSKPGSNNLTKVQAIEQKIQVDVP